MANREDRNLVYVANSAALSNVLSSSTADTLLDLFPMMLGSTSSTPFIHGLAAQSGILAGQ